MKNLHLVETHEKALFVWQKSKVKNIDLVHIDAHIDFRFLDEKNISNRKKLLKNINSANYICPAVYQNIVKDFYWVIPGGKKDFLDSKNQIKKLVEYINENASNKNKKKLYNNEFEKEIIKIPFLGRSLFICNLNSLPVFSKEVLLDIDVDFLVMKNLECTEDGYDIKHIRPWIMPSNFVRLVNKKIKRKKITVIAYSAQDGYTPILYRHFGDEIAYCFNEKKHKGYDRVIQAANYFSFFNNTGKKSYYKKAVALDKRYRGYHNNYGPFYLNQGKLESAYKEFIRIASIDKTNYCCFFGLACVCMRLKRFSEAERHLKRCLSLKHDENYNHQEALINLAIVAYKLKNYIKAKRLFQKLIKQDPKNAFAYYFLGLLSDRQKMKELAACNYQKALLLGYDSLDNLYKLSFLLGKNVVTQKTKKLVAAKCRNLFIRYGAYNNSANPKLIEKQKKISIIYNNLKKYRII